MGDHSDPPTFVDGGFLASPPPRFDLADRHFAVAVVALVLVIGLAHAGNLGNGFHYDDGHSVVRNPHIHTLDLPRFLLDSRTFSERPEDAMYRPLVVSSLATNFLLGGLDPWGYHLFNLAVHCLAATVVCVLLRAMGLSKVVSLSGALLFGLHPAQSEVVNYVSARSESLAALFYLCSFALYASADSRGSARTRSRILYAGSLLAFALALLSKAVAMSLPLMLLFYSCYRCDPDRGSKAHFARALPGLLPYWTMAGAYALLYRSILLQAGQGLYQVRDPLSQLATQGKAIVHYLKLVTLPVSMSVHPQFSESAGLLDGPPWSACLMGASLAAGALALRRRNSLVLFGAIWFFVALLPVLAIPLNILVNDHRLYLALVGPVVALSSLLERVPRRWPVFCFLAGLFAVLTYQRNGVWRDEITLWADAATRGPAMPAAHYNLAYALHQDGELGRAMQAYQAATRLDPSYVRAHVNLGALYRQTGATRDALEVLQRAVELDPRSVEALNNLGLAHADGGACDMAISAYEEALSVDGEVAEVWLNLGMAYREKGLVDLAFQCLSRAIQLDPGMKDRYPAGSNGKR